MHPLIDVIYVYPRRPSIIHLIAFPEPTKDFTPQKNAGQSFFVVSKSVYLCVSVKICGVWSHLSTEWREDREERGDGIDPALLDLSTFA